VLHLKLEPKDVGGREGGVGAEERLRSPLALGSLTSTQRIGRGGVPVRYHSGVSEVISSFFSCLRPYQEDTVIVCHGVAGSESRVFSLGNGAPFCAGRPTARAWLCGAGAKRLASSRSRLMKVARLSMAWVSSWTAKVLSPTKTMSRPGNQRQSWSGPSRLGACACGHAVGWSAMTGRVGLRRAGPSRRPPREPASAP